MAKLGILNPAGDRFANVIVGDPARYPDAVDLTAVEPCPGRGWEWDGAVATPPMPVLDMSPGVVTTPMMTHVAFLKRLTGAEEERLDAALQASWQVRAGFRKFENAREIDVRDADLQTQIAGFGASGILDAPERVPVLLAEIAITERGAINPATFEVTP